MKVDLLRMTYSIIFDYIAQSFLLIRAR